MGTLYEHKTSQIDELRETYHGVLLILRHFIAKDTYTENHSYRVSVYAATIAMSLNLPHERVEDVRAAALLHDIGKLDVSRELLYKAARLTKEEYEQMQQHVPKGVKMLEPVGGSLRRVIPIVLAHHDKFDGTGYHPTSGRRHSNRGAHPVGGRRLRLADERSAVPERRCRPSRRRTSSSRARAPISIRRSSAAFTDAFRRGGLEVPAVVV